MKQKEALPYLIDLTTILAKRVNDIQNRLEKLELQSK